MKLLILLSFLFITPLTLMSQTIPLVYDVENTGKLCPTPMMKTFEDLERIAPLTDPFEWSDGSGRSTEFEDWACRRTEIAAEVQHYEVGEKPGKPDLLTAEYKDSFLIVNIKHNGEELVIKSKVVLPQGKGPFPAVIGIGRPTGSLPQKLFIDKGIAGITFSFDQVMSHTQNRGEEPINKLYPDLIHMGAYSAWPWGVSRIIDGLELVQDDLPVDLKHIGITGCSFAGKMALYSGAFDERIALTIAQESGGGGAAAWRVSETLGNVETLSKTNFQWFLEDLRTFGNSVEKLPFDHHEIMGMVAPRALLVLGNPDYEWLADDSGFVSSTAAKKIYEEFGIGDRFGYSIVAGHGHCQLPEIQYPEVNAFIDKFLLGKKAVDTENIAIHPFDNVDHEKWSSWWGSDKPIMPEPDTSNIEWVFLEPECGNFGSDWDLLTAEEASNGKYVTIKSGMNSTDAANTDDSGLIEIPFTVDQDTTYYIFARVNAPSAEDDSFWISIDDKNYEVANGLGTTGWEWVDMTSLKLEKGTHTLNITYREDGILLDKIAITNYRYGPTSKFGRKALNNCE